MVRNNFVTIDAEEVQFKKKGKINNNYIKI